MIALAGGDLVLPDRVLPSGSLLLDPNLGIIAAVEPTVVTGGGRTTIDCRGHVIVPGFVDVHVHGVDGIDVLDGPGSVAGVAARLPKYGVTAFCPTSIACPPHTLQIFLDEVAAVRAAPAAAAARVLPAHLESNFINPEWRGAQPESCLRQFTVHSSQFTVHSSQFTVRSSQFTGRGALDQFDGDDILAVIAQRRAAVGIVTVAPELDGGMDLVRELTKAGHVVSIGHSGATYEQALASVDAGVRHATHLFNRMSPLAHRAPGVAGAVLESRRVLAEIICDGFHVHPSVVALALRAKGPEGLMAITDGTAGSGLPVDARARLGGQTIVVTPQGARLEDGTLAGSVLTMDGAFRMLAQRMGVSLPLAARICAATPAAQLGQTGLGLLAPGSPADVTVLDRDLRVRQTFIAGRPVLEPPLAGARLSG